MLVLAKHQGKRAVVYFEDRDCAGNGWTKKISNNERIGAGLDLALDAGDRPRFVFTLDYNITGLYCRTCLRTAETAEVDLTKVEFSSDLPKDDIILYPNCTVSAWFLHDPLWRSPRRAPPRRLPARDVMGGVSRPDPTRPARPAPT